MESSGSDCDSNVDNDVSASALPVSSHYQTGNYFCPLRIMNERERKGGNNLERIFYAAFDFINKY